MSLEQQIEELRGTVKALRSRLEILEQVSPAQSEWLTTEEVMRITGWSRQSAYSKHLRNIERSKRGKRIYIRRTSLMSYLGAGTIETDEQQQSRAVSRYYLRGAK